MTVNLDQSGTAGHRPAQALVDEFDEVAGWTADAVLELGPDYALPAACRGSGSPAALDWLIEQLQVTRATRLLDVGAGVGGPSGYVAATVGAQPVLVDPMAAAIGGAVRLFGLPSVVADGAALPFGDDTFDTVWSLGVLCTVPDKQAHLSEMVRVLRPGGSVGLLVYERTEDLRVQPDGNHFPTDREVRNLCEGVGLDLVADALVTDFEPAPAGWQAAADRVDLVVGRRHRHRRAWQRANDQQHVLGKLIEGRSVVGRLSVCRSRER